MNENTHRLAISVILPTYNRPIQLKACLEALLRQKVDQDWEIIVIDDGSKVDLQAVVNAIPHKGRIRYYRQENQGPGKARNKGVALAKGKTVLFIDDDCEAAPNWVQTHLNHSEEGLIVGGYTSNKLSNNLFSESSQLLVSYLYEFFEGTKLYFFTSNNFSMDRKTFLKIGGFDSELFTTSAGEDRELCVRWLHLGYRLKFVKEAQIYHFHALTLRTFCKMHFKYGTAADPFRKKMEKLGVNLNEGQSNFFNRLLAYPFQFPHYSFLQKTSIMLLLALSQVAGALGFFYAQNKS